jgi:hypothetical protein
MRSADADQAPARLLLPEAGATDPGSPLHGDPAGLLHRSLVHTGRINICATYIPNSPLLPGGLFLGPITQVYATKNLSGLVRVATLVVSVQVPRRRRPNFPANFRNMAKATQQAV